MRTFHDTPFRLFIIGDTQTGKSNIYKRITRPDDPYWDNTIKPTRAVNLLTKYDLLQNRIVKIQVWDTRGSRILESLPLLLFKVAQGFLLVFDITNRESFKNIPYWLQDIQRDAQKDVEKVLVGNKCDLEEQRQVSYEEARLFAEKHHLKYFEISAKTGESVDCALKALEKAVLESLEERVAKEEAAECGKEAEKSLFERVKSLFYSVLKGKVELVKVFKSALVTFALMGVAQLLLRIF